MEISEIKERLTLARVLQHYGLKPDKHGRLHCPFHEDHIPSLQVYDKTNTVYCFSTNCPTHGRSLDVIDLVMHKENCTKHEAIERCKELIGSEATTPPPAEPLTRTAVLTRMFTYFTNAVSNSKPAQEYLRSRALDSSKLEVGYNTGQFHHGTRRDEGLIGSCLEVGLLSKHDRPGRTGEEAYRPFAKYCIVFALRNKAGQVTGLYFRSTVNDTDQRHFYLKDRQGLYPRYPPADTKKLILTESVIDAATLLQVPAIVESYSVLALYGTNGLTDEHTGAIKELSQLQELIFWLNADAAGDEATKKQAAALRALYPQLIISQVHMPEGEDVNSLAQTHHDPGIFTDLVEARQAPGAGGGKLFVSSEKSIEKKKRPVVPVPCEKPVPPAKDLDTSNPYKLRYHTDTAHYYIQGSLPKSLDTLKVMLVIEHPGTGQKARNRVDLYEDKAVERLGQEVSERLNLRRDGVAADLYRLTDLVEQYRERELKEANHADKPLPVLTVKERQEGESFAKKPRLIKRLNELLGQAGIVGEERNRIFLLLIAISHKMPETLHGLLQGSSGSGKTRLLRQISDCMPPESVTRLTRLSDKVLYNFPEHYFVNRLLSLEDIDGLSEEAEFAFRELQSNGELNSATSIKLESGQITSGQKTVRGPIASLACTTRGEIYEDNMSRVFLIAVDESPEQTARILAYQNGVAAGAIDKGAEGKIKTFLQNFVRILQPHEVVNPYASRIQLPPEAHKIRRLNDLLQSFVKMVTILNQYRRKKDDRQRLISEVEDVETAVAVLLDSIVLKVDELDGSLRQFYEQLKGYLKQQHNDHHQTAGFSLREVRQALKLSKTQLFRYAADLVQLEYIHASGGHVNRGYTYQVAYWDNYQGLRERIRCRLEEQVKVLKAGTPAPETPESGTPRNASGTLEPA